MEEQFEDGRYVTPISCAGTFGQNGQPCKSRSFEPQRMTARTIDYQRIKLQEMGGRDGPWPYAADSNLRVRRLIMRCLYPW